MKALKRMIELRQEMLKISHELKDLEAKAIEEALAQSKKTFSVDGIKVQVRFKKLPPKREEHPEIDTLWTLVEKIAQDLEIQNFEKLEYHRQVVSSNRKDIIRLTTSPELEAAQKEAESLHTALTTECPTLAISV